MNKHIILICENGQYGLVVDKLSVHKAMKSIVDDLSNPTKQFIELNSYAPKKDSDQEMWVRTRIVNCVMVVDISNIKVPSKKLVFPSGKSN